MKIKVEEWDYYLKIESDNGGFQAGLWWYMSL